MRNTLASTRHALARLRQLTTRALGRDRQTTAAGPAPLRGELFNPEQLEHHARAIAAEYAVMRSAGNMRPLQARLDQNEQQLGAAHEFLLDSSQQRSEITPAAEWLLDNFHIVVDQIREIRQDLPRGYYRELPKLRAGPLAGQPRVYALALELIEHTDGRIDLELLLRFISAYQSVAPLTMGELWAVAIMLRVGLVENLARLARLIVAASTARAQADTWADRLLAEDAGANMGHSPALAELTRSHTTLPSAFAVRLLYRLRAYDGERDIGPIITWLEQQPVIPFTNVEALIHAENQRQASSQVAIGNTITSMRVLSTIDWADWFERVSLVEQVLREDPARAYAGSTRATRDHYRHAVEQLARGSQAGELVVARAAVDAARAAGADPRASHVGFHLIGPGRAPIEAALGYRATPAQALQRTILSRPTAFYLGSLAAATAGALLAGRKLAGGAALPGRAERPLPAAFAFGLLLPASALAKELVDRGVARLLPPRTLPRLDLRGGIPAELRTIVVVPTLLLTPDSVRGQIEAIEVLALANDDPHLHFALLSDFADAPAASMPDDDALLAIARAGVAQLNERAGGDRFFLLHRRRVWNEQQRCFMGWERKRGKLEEFNQLLAGAPDTTFATCDGNLAILPQIRYVITLDADTQLPRDAGRALIGTLAHPLNQAVIDPATRLVTEGYGILQPRVGIDLPSAMRSRFARIFSGNVGLDPYTTASSDVYMDQFGEGIYAGKGIYDPAVLRATLAGRFPENRLLSHDLIEGCYARAGLLSDVELLDSYPAAYASFAARQHRWVRGDWQIASWLLPTTPSARGPARNVLPAIARFKIFDNLRRSLVPPATVALLAAAWLGGPSRRRALALTGYGLLPLALPLLFDMLGAAGALLRGPARRAALRPQAAQLGLSALRSGLNITFLLDQSTLNLDAIARTLTRLLITRRDLLEWETAAEAHRRLTRSSGGLLRRMAPAGALGALGAARSARQLAASWPAAAPLLANWLAAPAIAAWLDQPVLKPAQPLGEPDRLLLRQLARATWAYFEQFETEEVNFLAPDNFQESPSPLVANRTSPTNIGIQLLADLAAYDFGYIGLIELTERVERVLATLARLQRYRGHLLNWYDTQSLEPLPPAYVSTVDSGNLAGHLLTLRQGLLGLRDRPIIGTQALAGLHDTLALAEQALPADAAAARAQLAALAEPLAAAPATLAGYRSLLAELAQRAGELRASGDAATWLARLAAQARSLLADLAALAPADLDGLAPPTLLELAELRPQSERPQALPAMLLELDVRSAPLLQHDRPQPAARPEPPASIAELLARHDSIAARALAEVHATDFRFLYDDRRRIFSIGYSVAEERRDTSYYDLLASEARLASFLAIAKGDVPQEHWFHIGRTLLESGAGTVLASWSGTMFEYLMPLLVMRSYPRTLLDATYQVAVERQIRYGRQQHVPWGVSESAYNVRDPAMNYQYRAFGVPGLGLKRGLGGDLVVAPYASALTLLVQPAAAIANLRALIAIGMSGRYGLYEAIDYTPDRLPPGASHAIVRSFMVHHQGMSLLAFANALHDYSMQRRFHAEPIVQATEMLLQERLGHGVALYRPDEAASRTVALAESPTLRQVTTPTTAIPYTHLLSNGAYSVMVTNAGGGYSTSGDMAVTRWRADAARDCWGSFCYIRDVRSDLVWSAAYQPTRHEAQDYRVIFGLEKVEFRQHVAGIETRLELSVSPEDNVEVRRLTLTNLTGAPRELELTSYAEVVLAPAAADAAHPAFSNLFVETEFVAEHDALLAARRPRSAAAERRWALHVIAVRGHSTGATSYETDRAAFVGRGRTTADPRALHEPLSQQSGAVLDPIFSLRRRVRIVPGGSAQIIFTTGVADSREQALQLADKYRDPDAAARAFAMAWTQCQVELRHLNIGADDAQRFQRLAAAALYMDGAKRAKPEVLAGNQKGQPGLWAYGISGDEPIIVVQVESGDDLSLVRELIQAHQYWRLKRLTVDLVIVNEHAGGYLQGVHDQILGLVRSSGSSAWLNQRGGIFALRADMLPAEDLALLQTVARVLLSTRRGGIGQHLRRRVPEPTTHAPAPRRDLGAGSLALPALSLSQRTPYGGFDEAGEFVIDLAPGQTTPAPWSNVVANQHFGFVVTESGGGYTWSQNSRENRLTPWSNDPVSDPPGEVVYLHDLASGALWSAAPQPASGGHMRVRHGFGSSSFSQQRYELASELRLAVAPEDSVKLFRLSLTNHGAQPRRLAVTLYVEWVLGVFREHMAPYVVTSRDEPSGALMARNAYNPEFGGRVAFIAASEPDVTMLGDRVEFIGRNGDLGQPAALQAGALSGNLGAGLDPCGAISCVLELAPGEQRELVFLLGQGADLAEARDLVARFRTPDAAAAAERQSAERWRELLGQAQVVTPQPELDLLLNGWLLYQTLACRVWARSAFYQSGGAYGFRDQLQDVMALAHSAPAIAREQIVRAASRQFVAGDVQHWWHPPSGRGVRTKFSDDYLWLPFVTDQYIAASGDGSILDEQIGFLEGRPLAADEAEYYDLPTVAAERATLYEHCVRAIERALGRMGAHGLPLMGAGDWNDGMNMVGDAGRGESVWVGWFLLVNLARMAEHAAARGESARAARYLAEAARLRDALEQHAWDGAWYLRAFYDDGTPLGAAASEECRIDSLTQSWAVIAGAGDPARARQSMASVDAQLVDAQAGLIKLFAPPFDRTNHDPGYIKGYVPGVRENGGQYTHAAIWTIWAYALLGDGAKAGALLDLINPIRHALAAPETYKVEPYSIAADVYSAAQHSGRGGWTWYTGSAGWLYRLGLEMILGLRRSGDTLTIAPCIPPSWPSYQVCYRYGQTRYQIEVLNPRGVSGGVSSVLLDGEPLPGAQVALRDDGGEHTVQVTL